MQIDCICNAFNQLFRILIIRKKDWLLELWGQPETYKSYTMLYNHKYIYKHSVKNL